MNIDALTKKLEQLITRWESEVVEFKQGGNGFSSHDLGRYVSALANEANLRGQPQSWLVFGVNDKYRNVIGTDYKDDPDRLQADKLAVRDGTGSFTFRNIFELDHINGRVVMFEIPAAPRGMPIAWKGHFYGRAGESLVALAQDKLDEIRNQTLYMDWTAQIIENATVNDLDTAAVKTARDKFAAKHAEINVNECSDITFLDRARITIEGKITRTALMLLGKPQSAVKLNPNPLEITWNLIGNERDYTHFSPPFLMATSDLYSKIRNIRLQLLPENELLRHEVSKYDQKVVLEALHNCIAHQDYTQNARIIVTEYDDRLIFENEGSFFEGLPVDYIMGEKRPPRYRNPFLAQAMTELNMIDHMGYGIHDIYQRQRKRFFPLPDYDLTKDNKVLLTIHGKVVDPAYSRLLMQKTKLDLIDVLNLDRVQKKLPITDDAIKHLRREKLIEGRKPNFHVSAEIAAVGESKADYILTRAQDDDHYARLLHDYLKNYGTASRKEVNKLLLDKLSTALNEDQKSKKVGNLLTKLRRNGIIENTGSKAAPRWKLAERNVE